MIADKRSMLFDKTPVYMKHLPSVLARVPGLPCVVNVRDQRALMVSWAKWSGGGADIEGWVAENFCGNVARFRSYAEGYRAAADRFSDRILLNRFETMCLEPRQSLQRVFAFLGLQFSEDYLNFSSKHFVYGSAISTDYLYPYRGALSEGLSDRILEATAAYADWHFQAQANQ